MGSQATRSMREEGSRIAKGINHLCYNLCVFQYIFLFPAKIPESNQERESPLIIGRNRGLRNILHDLELGMVPGTAARDLLDEVDISVDCRLSIPGNNPG